MIIIMIIGRFKGKMLILAAISRVPQLVGSSRLGFLDAAGILFLKYIKSGMCLGLQEIAFLMVQPS